MKTLAFLYVVAIFTIAALLFCGTTGFAQQDSAISYSKYIGVLYTGSYDSDGIISHNATFRLGGDAVLPVIEQITLSARAGYDVGSSGKGAAFGKMFFERKSSVVDIAVGYALRPIGAAMRPAPLTGDGHFEPPSLAVMPASGTGLRLGKQLWNNGPSVMAGLFYLAPSRSGEWNLSVRQKAGSVEFLAAGYTSRIRSGIAAKVATDYATVTAFTTSDSLFTGLIVVPTKVCDPFVTVNYDRNTHRPLNLEVGWTKVFALRDGFHALVGMGYQQHSRLLNMYVQMYL